MSYESFSLTVESKIAHLRLNRPEKANSLHEQAFRELAAAFRELDRREEVRVIILSGEGKHFCAGIDLSLLLGLNQHIAEDCEGRKREKLRDLVLSLQEPMNAAEACRKPVIAAIHGGCIGAGLDLVAACDLRYCVAESYFTIKEIDMGMVADLGVLQRLPGIISEGHLRDMAYTGRKVPGAEAVQMGLANKVFDNYEEMMGHVKEVAGTIASKSPLSIRGSKEILNYNRQEAIDRGLKNIALWNAAMILSEDLQEAGKAAMTRSTPEFRD